MLYNDYQKKVNKTVKTVAMIRRFRFLIIGAAVSLLVLFCAFFAIQGVVYGERDLPSSIEYGTALKPSAKGILSKVQYEYRAVGSYKWSFEVPTTVGEYQVRPVAWSFIGKRRGDIQTFTIAPRAVTIGVSEDTIRYGDVPTASAPLLAEGDRVDAVTFTYDDITATTTQITPDLGSIVLRNSRGEDVTSSYAISTEASDITFTKRDITITVEDVTVQYNGTPLKSEKYEISAGTLAGTDKISTITFPNSQTEVGTAENIPEVQISTQNNLDVTSHYNITKVSGKLTVTKRDFVVETGGGSFVYDGTAHKNTDFTYDSVALLDGHTIELVSSTEVTDVSEGKRENIMTFCILNAEGRDVTEEYYFIRLNKGFLEVTPRPVTVVANNGNKVYDGTALTEQGATTGEGELVGGHYVDSLGTVSSIINAGEIANRVIADSVIIRDAAGKNVSGNYLVTGVDGKLSVTPRPITIVSGTASAVYNGKPFKFETCETSPDGIVEGEILHLSYAALEGVGSMSNTFTASVLKNLTTPSTDNYAITPVFGTLTVTERPVTFTADSAEQVYNGKPLTKASATDENGVATGLSGNGDNGLAPGHYVVVETDGSRTTFGTTVNRITSAVICSASGENVTDYYDIAPFVDGILTVTKRELILTAHGNTKHYDGTPLTEGGFDWELMDGVRGLVSDETVEARMTDLSTITNTWDGDGSGNIANEIDPISIVIKAGETPVTDNYIITCIPGTLTITPRPVTVRTDNVTKVYNGVDTPNADTRWTVDSGNFVDGEIFGATVICSKSDAGDGNKDANWYTNLVDITMTDGDLRNYDITVDRGVLVITPRPMWVKADSADKPYDGSSLTCETFTYEEENGEQEQGLLSMHNLQVFMTADSTALHVREGLVSNAIDQGRTLITDKENNPILVTNYAISYGDGTLEITKRAVTITVGDVTKVYDATTAPLASTTWEITTNSFVDGEMMTADILCSESTVGSTKTNKEWFTYLTNRKINGDFEDYDISEVPGKLTITPRPLTITAGSTYQTYDGTALTYGEFTYETENGDRGLLSIHDLLASMTPESTVTNVSEGRVPNVIDPTTIRILLKQDGSEVDLANYVVEECINGELYIIEREVTIKADNVTKIYDGTYLPQGSESWTVTSLLGFIASDTPRVELLCSKLTVGSTAKDTAWYTYLNVTGMESGSMDNYIIHTETGDLFIKPRPVPITIGEYERIYDGTINVYDQAGVGYTYDETVGHEGLLTGHTLADVLIIATTANANTNENAIAAGDIWETTLDLTVLKVMAGDDDMTANYTFDLTGGKLTITPREVTIVVDDVKKVYDATTNVFATTSWNVTVGNFVDGQNFVADVLCSKSTVGSTETYAEWYTYLSGATVENGDILNYDISEMPGKLTITPRHLTITADSDNKTYDGIPLTCGTFTNTPESGDFGLLDDHLIILSMTPESTVTYVTEGKVANVIDPTTLRIVWASDGTDVDLANYVIDAYYDGELYITPRAVTVKAEDITKIYDGTAATHHTGLGWYVTSELDFVYPHTFSAQLGCSEVDVGSTELDPAWYTHLFNINMDPDEMANYEITYEKGSLTITPRTVHITVGDYEREYDGTTNVYDQSIGYIIADTDKDSGLVGGHTMDLATIITTTANANDNPLAIAAGDIWETSLALDTIRFLNGNADVTGNYYYAITGGSLTITRRTVSITVDDVTKVYDGTMNIPENTGYTVTGGLVEGHTLSAIVLGSTANANENQSAIAAGDTWKTYLSDVTVMNDAENVTGNYIFASTEGKLTVTRREITITASSESKIYDGTPLTKPLIEGQPQIGDVGILSGHMLRGFVSGSITNVGKVPNVIIRDNIMIFDAKNQNVTENYHIIEYKDGELEVIARGIYIDVDDAEKVYDGTVDLDNKKFSFTVRPQDGKGTGLVSGDYFTAVVEANRADAGSGKDWQTIIRKDSYLINGDAEKAKNYKFIVTAGSLIITPRPIYVTVGDYEREYDGTTGVYDSSVGYTYVPLADGSGLLEGHEITFAPTPVTSTADAGSGEGWNTLPGEGFVIMSDAGDVSGNYTFVANGGNLTITHREVTVSVGDVTKVYDGTRFYTGIITGDAGLVEGHSVSAIVDGDVYIGTATQIAIRSDSVVINDGSGQPVTGNYIVSIDNTGSLTTTYRTLVIKTESDKKQYDGAPLTAPAYTTPPIENGGLPDGFVLKVTVTGTQTEVGESKNSIDLSTLKILDSEGNETDDTGTLYRDYFIIETDLGNLTVTAPPEIPPEEEDDKTDDVPIGALSGGGMIGLPEGFENSDAAKEVVAQIYAEASGRVYLRFMSFGDYNGQGWGEAKEYTVLLDDAYSMNYLTGLALGESGYSAVMMEIKSFSNYLIPYYTATAFGDYMIQTSDVKYTGDVSNSYTLSYYICDANGFKTEVSSVPATYEQVEAAYRAFVYENYTYIDPDSSVAAYMKQIIADEGFVKNDPDIITKVASYIQSAAKYNFGYDRDLDSADDIVVAFLDGTYGGEGVCQHFASAATMLYRAIGIPARYTVGYATHAEADKWHDVTGLEGHAWVEVYLDGIGWVQVEVTGSADGSGGDGDNEGEGEDEGEDIEQPDEPEPPEEDPFDPNLIPIRVYLYKVQAFYNGTPLEYYPDDWKYAEIMIDGEYVRIPENWTFELNLVGSLTDAGSIDLVALAKDNHGNFKLINDAGEDVTSQYRLEFMDNENSIPMTVFKRNVTFVVDITTWIVDGEEKHEYTLSAYDGLLTAYGHTVNRESLKYSEAGSDELDVILLRDSIVIYDAKGNDVTANYNIEQIRVREAN